MENKRLFEEYNKNKTNIKLRNEIVINNLKLVDYAIKTNNSYIPEFHDYEELRQEGYLKLIEAVESFNPDLGYKFSSYAVSYLKSISRGRNDYNKDVSLDTPLTEESEPITLLDTVEDENAEFETYIDDNDLYRSIREQLNVRLDNDEIDVIMLVYGIGGKRKTHKYISKKLDIPISRITTLQKKALTKLKNSRFFIEYGKEYYHLASSSNYNNSRISRSNKISDPVFEQTRKNLEMERTNVKEIFESVLISL